VAVDYAEQARTYDLTRGASPTVVRLLTKYLGPSGGKPGDGRSVLDIAGGTGNYAQFLAARGFRVTVLDRAPAMLLRAAPKLPVVSVVAGDALRLPFHDGAFDAAVLVSALHQFQDQAAALGQACRIVREGPFVLVAFTRENLIPTFIFEYFPGSDPPPTMHLPAGELEDLLHEAGFGRVERETFVFVDTADANLHALHTDPLALAGPAYLRNTSFFHRLPEGVRRVGLARLAADLRSGRLEERVKESFRLAIRDGHATVFAAWPGE
jgi:ubiquinone/menaquinone biosynthesis C-methylase UbiE